MDQESLRGSLVRSGVLTPEAAALRAQGGAGGTSAKSQPPPPPPPEDPYARRESYLGLRGWGYRKALGVGWECGSQSSRSGVWPRADPHQQQRLRVP